MILKITVYYNFPSLRMCFNSIECALIAGILFKRYLFIRFMGKKNKIGKSLIIGASFL